LTAPLRIMLQIAPVKKIRRTTAPATRMTVLATFSVANDASVTGPETPDRVNHTYRTGSPPDRDGVTAATASPAQFTTTARVSVTGRSDVDRAPRAMMSRMTNARAAACCQTAIDSPCPSITAVRLPGRYRAPRDVHRRSPIGTPRRVA